MTSFFHGSPLPSPFLMDHLFRPFIYESLHFDYYLYSSHSLNTGISIRYFKLFHLIFFFNLHLCLDKILKIPLWENVISSSNCFSCFPFPPKHLVSGQMHQPDLAQTWRQFLGSILSIVDCVLFHLDPSWWLKVSLPQLLVIQPRDSPQLSALSRNCPQLKRAASHKVMGIFQG